MIDVVAGALCALTYSVSPALVSPYGAPIAHAAALFGQAGVSMTRVEAGADVEFRPMPPLMFPRDYGGYTAGPGKVYLRVILPWPKRWSPAQAANVRTNVVIHELQHQLGMVDGVISPTVTSTPPTVPAVPEICGVG